MVGTAHSWHWPAKSGHAGNAPSPDRPSKKNQRVPWQGGTLTCDISRSPGLPLWPPHREDSGLSRDRETLQGKQVPLLPSATSISPTAQGPLQLQKQSWGHTESPSATKPPGYLSDLAIVEVCPPWPHVGPSHLRAPLCSPVPHGKKGREGPLAMGPPCWPKTCRMAAPSSVIPPQTPPSHSAHTHPQLPMDSRGHCWPGCPGNKAPFSRAAGSRGAGCQGQHCPLPAWHCQPRHLTPWRGQPCGHSTPEAGRAGEIANHAGSDPCGNPALSGQRQQPPPRCSVASQRLPTCQWHHPTLAQRFEDAEAGGI